MMAAARVGDAEASLTALQEAPDLAAVAGKAVAPEPSADSAGVTTAMVAEEAALAQAAAERERQTASKARAVVDDMAPEVRASRLDTLLQKSSLFAEFLKDKIQQVNQQRRDEQQQQQQEAPPVAGGKRRSPKRKATKRRASASSSSADTSADTSAGADAGAAGTVLQDGTVVSGRQPKLVTGGELREYQLEGVEWLLALYENGLNGILADEMGLGKTVQCVGFFAKLYEYGVKGPYLVVAPLSTLSNWVREFRKWAPDVPVMLYHGTPEERQGLRRQILRKGGGGGLQGFSTVVTSYEIVMRDRKHLQRLRWKYIVVDEGHRMKNLNCRLIKELKMYDSANRLLLTGTPLQNNLAELWSLLNFLLPDIFDDLAVFQRWFDLSDMEAAEGRERIIAQEEERNVLEKLHSILEPFLLRRLKADADISIPPKREVVVSTPLVPAQAIMYDQLRNRLFRGQSADAQSATGDKAKDASSSDGTRKRRRCAGEVDYAEVSDTQFFKRLDEGFYDKLAKKKAPSGAKAAVAATSELNVTFNNIMMHLRKCCNHPYLVEYPLTKAGEYRVDEDIVASSGKMQLLDRFLPALRKEGRKVLIFSQMTKMLDILQDYCAYRGYGASRLDGSMGLGDREEEIQRFQEDKDTFVFLLSTRAAGLGLNLVSADTVIIYDSDWNPQADLQAQDRCHRIGQKNAVMVYRMVAKDTVDQRMLERAEAKLKLGKMVIHTGKFKGYSRKQKDTLSADDLRQLLMDGPPLLADGDVVASSTLSQAELTMLLDRDSPLPATQGAGFRVVESTAGDTLF